MNYQDIILLAGSKIRTRRMRTFVSVLAISMLFGVIIATFMIVRGLRTSLEDSANTSSADIMLKVSQNVSGFDNQEVMSRAIELYKSSVDADKKYPLVTTYLSGEKLENPYLDKDNIFAIQASNEKKEEMTKGIMEELSAKTQSYDVSVVPIDTYTLRGDTIFIGDEDVDFGRKLMYLPPSVAEDFIQVSSEEDDCVPVILPADVAGRILNMKYPKEQTQRVKEDIPYISEKAIGLEYTAISQNAISEEEVTFKIVGLSPPLGNLSIARKANEFHVLDVVLNNLGASSSLPIVANDSAQSLKDAYTADDAYSISVDFVLVFSDVEQATNFQEEYSCSLSKNHCQDFFVEEILNNHVNIHNVFKDLDKVLVAFVVFFSIVAVIIMASTLSRIFDDERQSIALYRSIGASTKDIAQIYGAYTFMLCVFVGVVSLVLGYFLSLMATALSSFDLMQTIGRFYWLSDPNVVLIGFDWRILLIITIIFVVGGICFVFSWEKIMKKNIAKNLKS